MCAWLATFLLWPCVRRVKRRMCIRIVLLNLDIGRVLSGKQSVWCCSFDSPVRENCTIVREGLRYLF
jgi:hypothetical protein